MCDPAHLFPTHTHSRSIDNLKLTTEGEFIPRNQQILQIWGIFFFKELIYLHILNITSRRECGMLAFLMYLAKTFLSNIVGSVLKEVEFYKTSYGAICSM